MASKHGESLPDAASFTLVEDDDVAFTLLLCREVNRLYAEYQDGKLRPTEGMLAGLVVTVETLAAMTRSVTNGMPSMRITVAAAQSREMLAVMFDKDPMDTTLDPEFRQRYRDKIVESAQVAAVPFRPATAAAPLPAAPVIPQGSGHAQLPSPPAPLSPPLAFTALPGSPPHSQVRRSYPAKRFQGLRRLLSRNVWRP